MGCVASLDEKAAIEHSKQIDLMIKNDVGRQVKLGLFGIEESGKSTFLKQMKIIHGNGYTEEECLAYLPVVHSNMIKSLVDIINAMAQLRIEYSDNSNKDDAYRFLSLVGSGGDEVVLTSDLALIMTRVWRDTGIQNCLTRSHEYRLNDSAAYYLNALSRISDAHYIPTQEDVLRTSIKRTGIGVSYFNLKGLFFNILKYDSSMRSGGRYCLQCFEDLTAILFLVALSDYDILVYEGEERKRLMDTLMCFDALCKKKALDRTSIFLFLNKKDLFAEKIRTSPLTICFPEYTGSNTYEESGAYVQSRFEETNKGRENRQIYTHFTCATDTRNVEIVFDAVSDVIWKSRLLDFKLV